MKKKKRVNLFVQIFAKIKKKIVIFVTIKRDPHMFLLLLLLLCKAEECISML